MSIRRADASSSHRGSGSPGQVVAGHWAAALLLTVVAVAGFVLHKSGSGQAGTGDRPGQAHANHLGTVDAAAETPAAWLASLAQVEAVVRDPDGVELARLNLWVADTPAARQRGLSAVERLSADAGMLFWFDQEGEHGGFWMKDTLLPLDVVFLGGGAQGGWRDAAGSAANLHVLEIHAMAPCVAEPCPIYRADALYRAAVEVGSGALPTLPPGATFHLRQAVAGR